MVEILVQFRPVYWQVVRVQKLKLLSKLNLIYCNFFRNVTFLFLFSIFDCFGKFCFFVGVLDWELLLWIVNVFYHLLSPLCYLKLGLTKLEILFILLRSYHGRYIWHLLINYNPLLCFNAGIQQISINCFNYLWAHVMPRLYCQTDIVVFYWQLIFAGCYFGKLRTWKF